jgi:hypothetical protein
MARSSYSVLNAFNNYVFTLFSYFNIMLQNSRIRIKIWSSVLPFILVLVSCSSAIAIGKRDKFPSFGLTEVSAIFAYFAAGWLIPAFIIWAYFASNREEKTPVEGSGNKLGSFTLWVPTGRTIEGNPEAAKWLANFWLVACPAFGAYFALITVLTKETFLLTGLKNLDWVLFRIVFPATLLFLIARIINIFSTSSFFICRWLVFIWKSLIVLMSVNALIYWAVIPGISWLLKK